ncbi:unnamed protein product [Polarella glacialis]|uniref:Uncharacterized protein n=1 Tax=Polarella glacialis TaxID=89957 RepID=A0A813EVP2_POLGL|nr:unnamed protein product [Polarella glacialis]
MVHSQTTGRPILFPAYDGGLSRLLLNMEGDDLISFTDRDKQTIDARLAYVGHAIGWKLKLVSHRETGLDFITYVAYHMLICNNLPVLEKGEDFVMIPELKRFLRTKSWAVATLGIEATAEGNVMNFEVYARMFWQLPPMRQACRTLAQGRRSE